MSASPTLLVEPSLLDQVSGWLSGLEITVEGIPNGDLARRCATASGDGIVFCVGSDRTALLTVAGQPRVLPVRVAREADANVLADPAAVTVRDGARLASLFRHPAAATILSLFSLRPSDVRAALDLRVAKLVASAEAAGGLSIYAAGTIGRQALHASRLAGIKVKAFIDGDTALHGSQVDGIAVLPISSLARGVDIVVPALGRHVSAVTKAARERGARDVMSLSELYYISRRPGEPETDYIDDLFANRHRYASLFLEAADERSREVLAAVIHHRLTLKSHPLEDVAERGHPQWFAPEFLPKVDQAVFVDGGAFDGDTALAFVTAYGKGYKRIHAFELDPEIAERARRRMQPFEGVTIHNVGLSDHEGVLPFRSTGGTDGSIGSASGGAHRINVGTIDALVPEKIHLLKLDVEGEEVRALTGAQRHIAEDHPTISIALYHKAQDLWDLPRRVLDFSRSYKLFLRHYTDLAYETVAYALPA